MSSRGDPPGTATSGRPRRPMLPPPFPAVAVQPIQQMQDPNVTAGDVGRLIELDSSLTASLLRLVNSPFFGMRRQIGSVAEAVMVLGMGTVRPMVGLPQAIADVVRHHHAAPLSGLTLVQQAVWVADQLAGTRQQVAQAVQLCPSALHAPNEAATQARSDIDALVRLLDG
jgi:hypothetical protein